MMDDEYRTLTKEEIRRIWERMETEPPINVFDIYPNLCDIANGLKWSAIEAQIEAEKEEDA